MAWGWYGINIFESVQVKALPQINKARGMRLRKGNIQIGDERSLSKLHKEDRFNLYLFGEIHAVHDGLIPNARRDYFEDSEALDVFEKAVKNYFQEERKGPDKIIRNQSNIASHVKTIQKHEELKKEYDNPQKTYNNIRERDELEKQIQYTEVPAGKAKGKLARIQDDFRDNANAPLETIYKKITETLGSLAETTNSERNGQKKVLFETDSLHALNKKERKLVSKIFEIINDVLPKELADNLREKIKESLNE